MGFVVLVFGVVALVHYYLWRRLVKATTTPGRARRVLTWVLLGLGVLVPVTLVGSRAGWGHFLAWPGFFWIAVMFYLLVFLAVLEIPRALVLFALERRSRHRSEAALARRMADRRRARAAEPALTGEPVPVRAGAHPETAPAPGSPDPESRARPVSGPESPAAEHPVPEQEETVGEPAVSREVGDGSSGRTEPPARGGEPEAIGRRLFIARTAAAVAGVGALATVGYGVRTALGDPVIESVRVTLPRLDPRLSGLRFAVVSDIHLGPLTGTGHSERIVRMINSLQADVVAVVGDLVDGTVADLGRLARPLAKLESRYGSYFVTGNHEYYTANGPDEWVEELGGLGIRTLRNERVEIAHGGAVLDLAGVDDVTGTGGTGTGGTGAGGTGTAPQGPDFERALGGRDRSRSVVLLAHQPVQAVQAAEHGVDLQLSGHTHGGQMVPFNLVVPVQQPVVAGLGEVGGTQVYVTRGAGFWGPPVRVGAPPEITLLELRA
ncbi:membrane protein [Planomonospora parontospora subsp. parontospora]|uniref:Membrane protein n=2 Tax=Planomonospora parontospora TaxID=58119 RepID=A0AA37BEV3_9ACTN|nr:metallophosphoesterase [Planomonospora parontospora]GGK59451.1 membrane protein [Planomonospora parontospora]GII08894.1 membrane protein [Planomonospora parontospora subsp. parontospora]